MIEIEREVLGLAIFYHWTTGREKKEKRRKDERKKKKREGGNFMEFSLS